MRNSTRTLYQKYWSRFLEQRSETGSITPIEVRQYVKSLEGRFAQSTVRVQVSALRYMLSESGDLDEDLRSALRVQPSHTMSAPRSTPHFHEFCSLLNAHGNSDLHSARDHALISTALFGNLRRSEVAGILSSDIRWDDDSASILIRRPGSDLGREVRLPCRGDHACPVTATKHWLKLSGIEDGFLFRSISRWGKIGDGITGEYACAILRRMAKKAGWRNHSEMTLNMLRQSRLRAVRVEMSSVPESVPADRFFLDLSKD